MAPPVTTTILATLALANNQEIVATEVEAAGVVYLDIRERNAITGELGEGLLLRPEDWDRICALVPSL